MNEDRVLRQSEIKQEFLKVRISEKYPFLGMSKRCVAQQSATQGPGGDHDARSASRSADGATQINWADDSLSGTAAMTSVRRRICGQHT
jgi:hypothetical protein